MKTGRSEADLRIVRAGNLLWGLGGVLAAAGIGYVAYRMTGKPFSVDPRRESDRTSRRRLVGVRAASIAPDKPISTNGEARASDELWWRR